MVIWCYGLIVFPQSSCVQALKPPVLVLGGEASGRYLGLDEVMRWVPP